MKSVEQWVAEDGGPHFDIECEGCHEIIRAIQADAQPQWQPIDTAPWNGKRVLVWDPAVGEGHMVAWHDSGPCCWLCAGHIIHPTHWQPLPEPPK